MTPDALTLAHFTDAHLAFHDGFAVRELAGKRGLSALNWARKRRRLHRAEVAEALVADLKAHAPDHVAMTGDVANFGLPREFARAADWLAGIAPARDLSFVPGNHEAIMPGAEAARDRAFAPFITGDEGAPGFPYLRRRGPVALIGLSSSISTAPFLAQGALGARQIAAMEALLRAARGLCRVILIHHPPTGIARPRRALRDRAAAAAAIARAGAELVLHGHDHRAELSRIAAPDRPIAVLGAPSASIGPGAREDAAEWRRLTILREAAAFRIEVLRRRIGADGAFADAGRFTLTAPRPRG